MRLAEARLSVDASSVPLASVSWARTIFASLVRRGEQREKGNDRVKGWTANVVHPFTWLKAKTEEYV